MCFLPFTLHVLTSFSCFLSNSLVFWLSFMGPIFALLLVNLSLFVAVIVILVRHAHNTVSRREKPLKPTHTLRLMASIGCIIFLFGLSWLFAALTFSIPALRTTAQIFFAFFNSSQGVFLFLFFCVLNHEARESWKKFLCCGRYKSINLSSFSVGARRRVGSNVGNIQASFNGGKHQQVRSPPLTCVAGGFRATEVQLAADSGVTHVLTAATPTHADTTFTLDTPPTTTTGEATSVKEQNE